MGRCLPLVCLLTLGGCHLLFPFDVDTLQDGGAGPVDLDTGGDGGDGGDGPLKADGLVDPDGAESCSPPGHKVLALRTSGAGDWSLALEPGSVYTNGTITGPGPQVAAATIDYIASNDEVAGFVVSHAAGNGTVAEVAAGVTTALGVIASSYNLLMLHQGATISTWDGHAALVQSTFQLKPPKELSPSAVRNAILPYVLKKSVSGLPGAWGTAGPTFILRITTVLRKDGRAIFLGAVTRKAADDNLSRRTRRLARGLVDTTALAKKSATLTTACESPGISQPLSPVDIIWVMDESASMSTERNDIADNASSFIVQAQGLNLDFRMGVTNVCAPNKPTSCIQGKFCSVNSTLDTHMGGADRFLTPNELSIFQACIRNPPGLEPSTEHGLDNAREAVDRHLPRNAGDPAKIRPGAQVVIITVTDEIPAELSGVINSELNACSLTTKTQANLNAGVKLTLDFLRGVTEATAAVSAYHVIGGVCGSTCSTNQAHGYKELAAALGGSVYDVCAPSLKTPITDIINEIKAAAGEIKMIGHPVSASVLLALNKKGVPRSRINGFDYAPLRHAIQLFGSHQLKTGDTVVVSYRRWN